jgi:hypothetical protein
VDRLPGIGDAPAVKEVPQMRTSSNGKVLLSYHDDDVSLEGIFDLTTGEFTALVRAFGEVHHLSS